MKIINSKDFLQIRLESTISSLDIEFLAEAYASLIGLEAVGLYLSLKQQELLAEGNIVSLETWLTFGQATPQGFHQARIQLEAVGLIRTYQQAYEKTYLYTLSLFAPKSPKAFLEDPILKGLLLQRAGQSYLKRLEMKYALQPMDHDVKEVSVSFGEVFHPDLNHPAFMNPSQANVKGKTLAEIRQPFDEILFAEQLQKQFSIDIKKLNQEDIKQMVAIATLTGLDELAAAEILGTNLDLQHRLKIDKVTQAARQEKRLPFVRQRQQQKLQLQDTSSETTAINQMEMLAPLEFLSLKQEGSEVAAADFSLLLRLQSQYGLPNPVINALIHVVLNTQNNALVPRYVEKLAGNLKRAKLEHAIDTLDFFHEMNQPRQNKSFPQRQETLPTTIPNEETPLKPTDVDESELKALEKTMKGLK
jgi:replication initiation and membrane attachment protein